MAGTKMRVGERISDEAVRLIAEESDWRRGIITFRHARCGAVEIARSVHGDWFVTAVEKPDAP